MSQRNEYLDHGVSDISDAESAYDSEAAEQSRTKHRGNKRRKLSHSRSNDDSASDSDVPDSKNSDIDDEQFASAKEQISPVKKAKPKRISKPKDVADDDEQSEAQPNDLDTQGHEIDYTIKSASSVHPSRSQTSKSKDKKPKTPGVVYLSSLPPYLRPSALRNILTTLNFSPITRLFLTPTTKHSSGSKKSSRQRYSEGWIEFASKATAKRCVEALNAQRVGGKKGGFYYDDLWNMKYLRGMSWEELMAGVREEKREEEGRRDEERRRVGREAREFVEGVERGRKVVGMGKKRRREDKPGEMGGNGNGEVQRVWRQHEVVEGGERRKRDKQNGDVKRETKIDPEVRQVLSKIF